MVTANKGTIYKNGVSQNATDLNLNTAAVTKNSNNWTSCSANTTPYVEYQDIYVSGELRQHIVWQDAAIFLDSTTYHNNATPTFPTASTSGLSATLNSFGPVASAQASASLTSESIIVIADIDGDLQMLSSLGDNMTLAAIERMKFVLLEEG